MRSGRRDIQINEWFCGNQWTVFSSFWLLVEKDKVTPPSGMTINRRLMKDMPPGASYFKYIKVNSVECF